MAKKNRLLLDVENYFINNGILFFSLPVSVKFICLQLHFIMDEIVNYIFKII